MSLHLNEVKQKEYNTLRDRFHRALFESNSKGDAIRYLNKRKFGKDVIDKFKIGWCPPDAPIRENLSFLRGRLVFPTVDEYGDVLGFSGRLLKEKKDTSSKERRWMNETYEKTFFLYGLDIALPNILEQKHVVIVEGQTDVLACHHYGINTTVGLMSDDLNAYQISKLMRFTRFFVLMLDGDKAGKKSVNNIIEKRIGNKFNRIRNLKLGVVDLKVDGKEHDPDSYLSDIGIEKMNEKIQNAINSQ